MIRSGCFQFAFRPAAHQVWPVFGWAMRFPVLILMLMAISIGLHAQEETLADQIELAQNAEQRYALALQALEAKRFELAQRALERVVAERPEFAGAWLDLAIASYRAGDVVVAIEHLEYLRTRFPLSPPLAGQIDYWLRQWQSPEMPPRWRRWQGEWQLAYGHDSNVNAGLSSDTLTLTLPGAAVNLPVDPRYLPQADSFWLYGGSALGAEREWLGGSVRPLLSLRRKQYNRLHEYSTLDLQAGFEYLGLASATGVWRLLGLAQNYRMGNASLYNGVRLNGQRIGTWEACQAAAGVEYEARKYPGRTNLGGNFVWGMASLACPVGQTGGAALLMLRAGHETPHGERPGGGNQTWEMLLHHNRSLSHGLRLAATWQYAWTKDQRGYSVLLAQGATRQLHRQTLVLQLTRQINEATELQVNLEAQRQSANLTLFQQKRRQISIGLVHRY